MLEESTVLGRDERMDDMRREVPECNKDALALADFGDEPAVAAKDPERDLQRNVPDRLRLGKAGLDEVIGADDAGNARNAAADRQADRQDHPAQPRTPRFVTHVLLIPVRLLHSRWRACS